MLPINPPRLQASLEQLVTFHEPGTLYTRRSFTDVYRQAREWLKEEMQASGLSVTTDSAGNISGRRAGQKASLPALATGSHIDTVANGGRFDGAIGVLCALEIVRALNDAAIELDHPLEIIDFLAEEPSAFGISTIGSRGMGGGLSDSMLALQDDAGRHLNDCIRALGGDPAGLHKPLRTAGAIKAFLELHIEQGPVLEENGLEIGVVTGIAGIQRYRVRIVGEQGHAGTVPMDRRQDALVAAAKVILEIQQTALRQNQEDSQCVATTGTLQVFPNHPNVIPGQVSLNFELRSIDKTLLRNLGTQLERQIQHIVEQEGCTIDVELLSSSTPVLSDEGIVELVERSAHTLGLTTRRLPSGAGHDT
ncbi:MAG: Zn-dependent hydrolase, partial [Ktedonobacteraceae bacterium]|nr:Zn-dependent hydrolase [Ktedonobacteraceae bacterium]